MHGGQFEADFGRGSTCGSGRDADHEEEAGADEHPMRDLTQRLHSMGANLTTARSRVVTQHAVPAPMSVYHRTNKGKTERGSA